MKVFKVLLILFIYLNITACSDTRTEKTYNKIVLNNTQDTISNRASIEKTVLGFLKWYKDNEDRLGQIHLIKRGLQDTNTNYSFDFIATKKYLYELKKSAYLSDTFIKNLQKHFIKGEEYLKKHPQNDGPIAGFEADLIMKSQDYMDVWSNIDNAKILEKEINNDKAYIKLQFIGNYKTNYYLTKKDSFWLIDNIENDFSEIE
jgi:hypothetical protein